MILSDAEPISPGLAFAATVFVVAGQIVVAGIAGYSAVKIAQLKTHVNSRMDELLDLNRRYSRAEGVMEGRTTQSADSRGKDADALKVAEALRVSDNERADRVAEVAKSLATLVPVLVHRVEDDKVATTLKEHGAEITDLKFKLDAAGKCKFGEDPKTCKLRSVCGLATDCKLAGG